MLISKTSSILFIVVTLLVSIGIGYWLSLGAVPDESIPKSTSVIRTTTEVSAAPKESPTAPDLLLQQTYTAEVNGTKVTVPISTPADHPYGIQGTIQQDIDLSGLVGTLQAAERQLAEKQLKKNWEISTGLGTHNGDIYVPIELQRNYSSSKAISVEIHLDTSKSFKVSGGELKHTWKF